MRRLAQLLPVLAALLLSHRAVAASPEKARVLQQATQQPAVQVTAQRAPPVTPSPGVTITPTPTPGPLPTKTPAPVPTKPPTHRLVFRLRSVRVQSSPRADFALKRAPLKHARSGKKVYVFIYWILRTTTSHSRPSYAFTVLAGKRTVVRTSFKGHLSSYPPNEYEASISLVLYHPGTYTVRGRVSFGNAAKQGSAKLTIR